MSEWLQGHISFASFLIFQSDLTHLSLICAFWAPATLSLQFFKYNMQSCSHSSWKTMHPVLPHIHPLTFYSSFTSQFKYSVLWEVFSNPLQTSQSLILCFYSILFHPHGVIIHLWDNLVKYFFTQVQLVMPFPCHESRGHWHSAWHEVVPDNIFKISELLVLWTEW